MGPLPRAASPLRHAGLVLLALAAAAVLVHRYGYMPLDLGKNAGTQRRAETRDQGGKLLKNVNAIDGDSLRADGEEIRLLGIDAPELRQTCRDRFGRNWACGRKAREQLQAFISRGEVRCTWSSRDRYGRALARCSAGAIADVGEAMVRAGLAVNFMDGGYRSAEKDARSSERGIWAGEFEFPADYRRLHPQTAQG